MAYEHLRLDREEPINLRHPRRGGGGFTPQDPRAYGAALGTKFQAARGRITDPDQADIGGYDDRKLIKIQLRHGESLPPDSFQAIPGVEIVSQEEKTVVLAFATDEGLDEFERRLATLARDGNVTRKDLLYAIEDFDHWTPEDRTGNALREQGFPEETPFTLDVELWPQERQDKRQAMVRAFVDLLQELGIKKLDELKLPSLVKLRVRCDQNQADQLLRHRDVRTVDLPPRLGVSVQLLMTDINQFPVVDPPPADAPAIAVLDSGLTSGHPLLAAAAGDAQGYLKPHRSANDAEPWHGTFVGGLALYGDVHNAIQQRQFVPQLRLFSGKVFEHDGQDQTEFVEKAVEEAVRDLHGQYGCKVFNLSYGDLNKVYDGRHVRGLAYTLDRLTRELGVLFVVPAGNLQLNQLPQDARGQYPHYLFEEHARLLDPATALNALTVGGISLFEATRDAQNHPNTIEDHILARANQPFPLTRRGPSINGAIKPDVVEHAGNIALMLTGGRPRHTGLGVVSLNGGFATHGFAFKEDIGTSYAAPLVAHKAARLLAEVPDASPSLLRALIGAHARWPQACEALLNPGNNAEGRDKLLHLVGYGRVDDAALFRSLDHTVTLLAEERVGNDQHHFFELPVPDSFWANGRRTREITVALAYSPEVRTTRLDYRRTKLWFNLVVADSLDDVTRAFQRNREEGMGEHSNGRWLPNDTRKNGTLQVSRWRFKQALANGHKVFVVVTRQDSPWSDGRDGDEPYAVAVVLADREQANAQLYAQVRAALQARAQARARARIGGRG
ncbi:S8 family peptidase [Pigmentiphaga sp. GD03639]|uniref:S8 family peptidase n=1 Tax=Pigmentiphaga sp. GD03639 TaxID=2975354 RepID=UPI00244D1D28|nr:S8 family peptidase [Pigmentiphaga sp. GD03639]MDH2239722.1 S8 family peptidase [Pigmentiphaga sp. GD03639]